MWVNGEVQLTGSNVDLKSNYKKQNGQLLFNTLVESDIFHIAISHNPDKYVYYMTINKVLKRITSFDPLISETLANINGLFSGDIQKLFVLPGNKLMIITTAPDNSFGKVYYCPTFATAPQEVLSTTTGYFAICMDASMDLANPLFMVGEYLQNGTAKKLYKSTNFTVFTEIKATNVNTGNSHWHAVAYDKYTGWIWAAQGDVGARGLHVSKDLGVTWTTIDGNQQPTLILPMRDRVVLGSDSIESDPGFDCVERNVESDLTKLTVKPLYHFLPQFGGHDNYPEIYHSTVDGDTAFVLFPSYNANLPGIILSTYDGGKTWDYAYIDSTKGIRQPRIALGRYIVAIRNNDMLLSEIPIHSEFDKETPISVEQAIGGTLPTNASLMGISDGVNIRALQGNMEGTLLPSAARTASASSPTMINYNARGVVVYLNVTSASGIGGLQVRIDSFDPISSAIQPLNAIPTAVTATGLTVYVLYPGATGGLPTQVTSGVLPRRWQVRVTHVDGSNYTYSVGYALIV